MQRVNNGVLSLSLWACFCMIVSTVPLVLFARENKMNEQERWQSKNRTKGTRSQGLRVVSECFQ